MEVLIILVGTAPVCNLWVWVCLHPSVLAESSVTGCTRAEQKLFSKILSN